MHGQQSSVAPPNLRIAGFAIGVLFLLAFSVGCGGAEPGFQGRRAWRLENERMRATVLEGGGHIAELVLKDLPGGESLNPLWIPPWPSLEPWTFSFERHGDTYGRDSEAATLAGIMGHNLCFDFWGAPSASEFKAGLAYHGDVSLIRAKKFSADSRHLTYRFDLNRSQTALTRTLRLVPGQCVLYFEETAENKLSIDRPIGWVQHPTFGPPFLDETSCFFDASATRGEFPALDPEREVAWPVGPPDEPELDFRRFAPRPPSQKMAYFLLDPSREIQFVSAVNTRARLLIAYVFRRADFPWLMVWEENRRIQGPPWNGQAMTRGMEFGNTRIPGTAKAYFQRPRLYDTPTFGWLNAREKKTVRYLALMANVPEGFSGVRDLRLEGSDIVIDGIGAPAPLRIPYDPQLFEPGAAGRL